ncbi:MAG: MarR family transcriptional regulator [Thermoplasmata archaeon]|nr:MarR family transcriptional regulator [Thermoplasmata archaeon]MCI4355759.1 MarR family transcriptional regulator [Thermoplasmata archaeon]
MNPPIGPVGIAASVRLLLELDRSLSPSDRKLLEVLMLRPGPTSARELSRRAGTNLQALYGALDRMEARGFVVRQRAGSSTSFRSSHPSVILHALVEPGRKAAALAGELEQPLARLYASGGLEESIAAPQPASTTSSPAAAASWLMDLVGGAVREIWFLGNETPWFDPAPALEGEIAKRQGAPHAVNVRLLVPPPEPDGDRAPQHARLERAGATVRYSAQFAAPTVIVDRRWLMLRSGTSGGARTGSPVYVRIDSPDLCRDLLNAGEAAWEQSKNGGSPAGLSLRAPETARRRRAAPPPAPDRLSGRTPLR